MTVTRYEPGLSDTQRWERSPAANPPSQGRQRAIERHAEISSGNGNPDAAASEDVLAYPRREIPGTA